jgi:hypothetical protein
MAHHGSCALSQHSNRSATSVSICSVYVILMVSAVEASVTSNGVGRVKTSLLNKIDARINASTD